MKRLLLFDLDGTLLTSEKVISEKTFAALIAAREQGYLIGMLQLCGTGIAMGNAHEEVKKAADLIIGSNDADGIALYIEDKLLTK